MEAVFSTLAQESCAVFKAGSIFLMWWDGSQAECGNGRTGQASEEAGRKGDEARASSVVPKGQDTIDKT